MYRRRRPTREIAFSFDSFLDMVANVVGVIIRLILVVWVGARSYTGLVNPPPEDPPTAETSADDASDLVALPAERVGKLLAVIAEMADAGRLTAAGVMVLPAAEAASVIDLEPLATTRWESSIGAATTRSPLIRARSSTTITRSTRWTFVR